MKVYLDDLRSTPEGWVRAYTAWEAIEFLETGKVEEISLDHDLGDEQIVGTGHDVIKWIEEAVATGEFNPPKNIIVHSSNPSGSARMKAGIKSIQRFIAKRKPASDNKQETGRLNN
jgi:hypothetical protein